MVIANNNEGTLSLLNSSIFMVGVFSANRKSYSKDLSYALRNQNF